MESKLVRVGGIVPGTKCLFHFLFDLNHRAECRRPGQGPNAGMNQREMQLNNLGEKALPGIRNALRR